MAEQPSQQHRLPPFPPVAADRHRNLHHGGVSGGIRRRVLSQHSAHAAVPGGHVLRDRGAHRVHHIRIRGDGQGVGPCRAEPGLFGVFIAGLLGLAGGARGE